MSTQSVSAGESKGTTYNYSRTNYTYARVDYVGNNKGLLTYMGGIAATAIYCQTHSNNTGGEVV